MAAVRLNRLEDEFKGSLAVSWKSYLIREEGVTVFDEYIASHFKRANEHEESITFNPWKSGPYPTWGMPALKAIKAAAPQGKEKQDRFHLAVMKAFYTDGRDISNEQVLEKVAEEEGLITEEFSREFNNPKWERIVYSETKDAKERLGISSIPAVVVHNRYLVEGAVSVSHYKRVIEEVKTSSGKE
ncbi:MAG: DsbA family protein [Deltaproteobacteria bacterium]|nr:DsbA family protein [Deltaproteobacteria bacterium]